MVCFTFYVQFSIGKALLDSCDDKKLYMFCFSHFERNGTSLFVLVF